MKDKQKIKILYRALELACNQLRKGNTDIDLSNCKLRDVAKLMNDDLEFFYYDIAKRELEEENGKWTR